MKHVSLNVEKEQKGREWLGELGFMENFHNGKPNIR